MNVQVRTINLNQTKRQKNTKSIGKHLRYSRKI